LILEVLVAIGVAGIDHQSLREPCLADVLASCLAAGSAIVGCLAATQDDMAVLVAIGRNDGRMSALGYRQEVMWLRSCLDGIHSNPYIAVRAVLEADRARQAGSQLAVNLAFSRSRADGSPRDQIGDVLRGDHVQELATRGHAQLVDRQQQ